MRALLPNDECIGSNADDANGEYHNGNNFSELPSSSKRRRCAQQLFHGCRRRRDKAMSIHGIPDSNNAYDSERDSQQKMIHSHCLDSDSDSRCCQPQPAIRLLPESPLRDPQP